MMEGNWDVLILFRVKAGTDRGHERVMLRDSHCCKLVRRLRLRNRTKATFALTKRIVVSELSDF